MFLGRLWGVGIYVNPFFLLLLGLFFVAGVLVKGLIAFGIVLVHELAHCLTARRLGIPADEVELLPFGGVTRMGSELVREPDREMLVAVAGPASNLVLTMLGIAAKNYGFWHHELGPFFLQCNLLIAAFNILPALPLDGGRVYRAYLARRLGVARATRRAARMGQWWGALVCLAGAAGVILGYSGRDIPV
ncbi:MAG: M50 family metallopeptidase, partial [Bacillota bacterium]